MKGKPSRQTRIQGFTLVELLVALFVFSLLSGFAYRSINSMISAGDAVEAEMDALASVQKAVQSLERDLRQKAVAVVASTDTEVPTINSDKTQLELTTLPSSRVSDTQALKHIRYSLQDKALVKEVWKNNKPTSEPADDELILLKKVTSLEFSSLDSTAAATTDSWPAYFQISLEHEDLGLIKRSMYFGVKKPELSFNSLTEPK
ncbi:MAG: type II secretion system protein GspJ [Thiolinea sp.]